VEPQPEPEFEFRLPTPAVNHKFGITETRLPLLKMPKKHFSFNNKRATHQARRTVTIIDFVILFVARMEPTPPTAFGWGSDITRRLTLQNCNYATACGLNMKGGSVKNRQVASMFPTPVSARITTLNFLASRRCS